jgi:predicted acyltransferase
MQADIATNQEPAIAQPAPVRRLLSLDTLRGFDMFWIMGGDAIFHTLANVTGWGWAVFMADQFTHVDWNGFRPYDCIFPLFLFLAGVSTPFSVGSRLHKGDSRTKLARKIIGRGLVLVLFGLILNNGLFLKPFDEMRFPSVLARIGLAGMCAQLIFLYVRNERVRYGIFAGILLGYWAMMMLIPVPGFGSGNLTMEGSLVGYVDRMVMPGHLYKVVHDPEGLLSTLPAICTGLLGVFAGTLLQRSNSSDSQKLQKLILGGIACVALGWIWNLVFPVNKNLWTSSFVLVAGGWSLLMLGLFYWIIDMKNIRGWTFFFMVIGMNSILIYMARKFIDFSFTAKALFGGLLGFFSEPVQLVGAVLTLLAVKWAFLYFLYRKKIFLRV